MGVLRLTGGLAGGVKLGLNEPPTPRPPRPEVVSASERTIPLSRIEAEVAELSGFMRGAGPGAR